MTRRIGLFVLVAASFALASPASAAVVDWWGHVLPANVKRTSVTVDGVRTPLLESGPRRAREAIVFVHGVPGASPDWVHLLSVAGASARAVAFDLAGLGQSDKPSNFDYTIEGEARFVRDALAQLGIARVHLVAHDLGGPVGLQWAAEHPQQLASAVLIDTGVLIDYAGHPVAWAWHTPVVGEATMSLINHGDFSFALQTSNPRPLPQDFIDRMYYDFDTRTRAAVLRLYRSVDNPDAMGRAQAAALRPERRPALVIWGGWDPYIPFYVAYEQNQAFPGAQVHVLWDTAHFPFVDDIAQTDQLVMPFWRAVLRSKGR